MASRKPNLSSMTLVKGSTSPSSPVVSMGSSSPVISVWPSSPAGWVSSPASAGSGDSPASAGSLGSAASATAVVSSASVSAVDPPPPVSPTAADDSDCGMQLAMKLLVDLKDADLRGNALLELCKEVIGIYPFLSPPTLTSAQSNRACNALALLQCVASHPRTRRLFVKAHIPLYLYSFLTTNCKLRPFEYLRLACLGVLGALVKVAAYILLKILQNGEGLGYVCVAADRFYAVGRVLRNLVVGLAEKPSPLLLKHIIKCYIRMSEDPRGRIALRDSLPEILMDGTFNSLLNEDPMLKRCLHSGFSMFMGLWLIFKVGEHLSYAGRLIQDIGLSADAVMLFLVDVPVFIIFIYCFY